MNGRSALYKMILTILLTVAALTVAHPLLVHAGGTTHAVSDSALANALGDALHKSAEDLTVEDLHKVTALYAYQNKNIHNLAGLEEAVNMGILVLDGNPIEDFSPLAALTKVKMLALNSTGIQDLTPISQMKTLNKLLLTGNRISDLSPLRNSTSLTDLLLENNEITDISALAGLDNLTWLTVSGNRIRDISALTHLSKLENLYLGNNRISSISPLLKMKSLKTVSLANNPLNEEAMDVIAALRQRGVKVEGSPEDLPASAIKIKIDGAAVPFTVNQAPFIEEDTTLVPFRPVFEQLGLTVNWDEASGTVTGTKGTFTISLQIGSKTAYVNGKPTELAVAPRIANESTFVPVRFVAEATGRKVDWQASSQTVLIDTTFLSIVNETLYSGRLKYEGEMQNGLPHGKGTYTVNGQVWYKGDFAEGRMEGNGLLEDADDPGSYYEGRLLNNLPDGQGKMVYSDGSYYEGDFVAGNRQGSGKLYNKDGSLRYEGQFSENAMTGVGTLFSKDRSYTGSFKNGLMFGPFKEYKGKVLVYDGDYQGSYREGTGKEYTGGKLLFEGEYMFGKRNGQGKLYQEGKLWYEGNFVNGSPDGKGIFYRLADSKIEYEGDVEQYKWSGNGTIYYPDGSSYSGQVYEGMANGTGTLYGKDGSELKVGFFFQDQWQANPALTKETQEYRLFDLRRSVAYYVINGTDQEDDALPPTQAIMELVIMEDAHYDTYQKLSKAERLDFMNHYVQAHWGDVLGVKQCFIIATYDGEAIEGTVTSYQQSSDKLTMVVSPRSLNDFKWE